MKREATSEPPSQQGTDAPQPTEKRVISSIVTRAKLFDVIKERHPVIARRDRPKD